MIKNKYFNNLLLNMVKVKYIVGNTIDTEDFYLCLNNANRQYDNSSITFKVCYILLVF